MEIIVQYRTRDGDVLDAICYKFYGSQTGHTEKVLSHNPSLADYGPILPSGIIIDLPKPSSVTPIKKTIRLWD